KNLNFCDLILSMHFLRWIFLMSYCQCVMEETVRSLLQNQDTLEGPSVDPLDLMKAYKNKLLEEMWKQQNSLEGPTPPLIDRRPNSPGCSSRGHEEDSHEAKPLLERLRALEVENSALTMENDNQRKQYERCLDEVSVYFSLSISHRHTVHLVYSKLKSLIRSGKD
ncbi:unnamed protein product, partial [Oncorhynchus mykiss]